jgi:hypothetical protein
MAARIGENAMLCATCRWTERPGFVRRPAQSASATIADTGAPGRKDDAVDFIPYSDFVPCPDCGGHAIAHCCEGLCEQPEPDSPGADG